jgi:serine/threonine protein kinase/uncharacterized protein (DUF433 family)
MGEEMGQETSRNDSEAAPAALNETLASGMSAAPAAPSPLTETQPALDPPAGRISGYQLLQEIRRDPESVVFKAIQQSTGKTVAVRVKGNGISQNRSSPEYLARQARELEDLNRLDDQGVDEHGHPFVVIELVAERPLDEPIRDLLDDDEPKPAGSDSDHEAHFGGAQQDESPSGWAAAAQSLADEVLRCYFPEDQDFVPCVAGTSVPLDCVLTAHQEGHRPEEIQRRFPELTLEQVYGTIAYYLAHRPEMDEYRRPPETAPDASSPRTGHEFRTRLDSLESEDLDATAPTPPSKVRQNGRDADRAASAALSDANIAEEQTIAPSDPDLKDAFQTSAPTAAEQTAPPSSPGTPAGEESDDATTAPSMGTPSTDAALRDFEAARKLGAYELLGRLGEGGMGAVYLARQASLDRKVAIKVLNSRLSGDASFVARFTREAYAAAQLTHHNIVQIHDLGEENRVHYFSMEFVDGQTLNNLLKSGGRIEPSLAANYILQAARGLKFAHDHSMIHRDIKPHNLMLNDQGLVKVVDLGLVKRKGASDEGSSLLTQASDASTTGAAAAMGTPAYMAPEQAVDAASVDARADIYSLGCAFYYLLTGRPPFVGATAVEVITKHATEPVIPPEKIVRNVPKSLSTILLKMMAKRPEDRYSSMVEVIQALEGYLYGKHGGNTGTFMPQEHHVRGIDLSVNQFNSVAWAYVRTIAIWTYFGVGVVGLLATIWGSQLRGILRALWQVHLKIAGGIFGLMVLTFVWYVVVSGFSRRAYLTRQVRHLISGVNWWGWVKTAMVAAVVVGILSALHLDLAWLASLAISFLIALAFHFTIDRALNKERRSSLQQLEAMCKTMRQQGMEEDELRAFVCERSGTKWEEIYVSLFGSDARISANLRRKLTDLGLTRKKWGALSNPIIDAIDKQVRRKEEQRRLEYFAKIEERRLIEGGMGEAQAKAKAKVIARDLIARAKRLQDAAERTAVTNAPRAGELLAGEWDGDDLQPETKQYVRRTLAFVLDTVLGPQVRLIAGLVVLGVFVIWLKAAYPRLPNLIMEKLHFQTPSGQADAEIRKPLSTDNLAVRMVNDTVFKITRLSGRPREGFVAVENKLLAVLGSWQGGLVGALLVISSLFSRRGVGLAMLASTLLILGPGHFLTIPTGGRMSPENAGMILGTIIAVVSLVLSREWRIRRRRRPVAVTQNSQSTPANIDVGA